MASGVKETERKLPKEKCKRLITPLERKYVTDSHAECNKSIVTVSPHPGQMASVSGREREPPHNLQQSRNLTIQSLFCVLICT